MLETATKFVPRSGASESALVASNRTSNAAGEPERAPKVAITLSTSRAAEGVAGPVLAASSKRCASPNPDDASLIAERSFDSKSPVVTRDKSEKPRTVTTIALRINVDAVTRKSSERRQIFRPTRKGVNIK
jgi:hypothetical protein